MYPLTTKRNHMLNKTKKMKCKLCKYPKVYDVLLHDRLGEVYAGKHTSHLN